MQDSLFGQDKPNKIKPLAHRVRPLELADFIGQEKIFKRYPFLLTKDFPSLILSGPPGTGKTTLAGLLAKNSNKEIFNFNAVLGGLPDLKKLIERTKEAEKLFQKESIIFIDEIHRFNKAQQDALLPYVETGEFILIGATTENPRTSINKALLSRVQIIRLNSLEEDRILEILNRAAKISDVLINDEIKEYIARFANGDARNALNALEALEKFNDDQLDLEKAQELIHGQARDYDKNQDRHYDVISAFIKSVRGSDPDSALLWLAVMLDGGEDPLFIARRLVILASEDIGNSDPSALSLAVSGLHTIQHIGLPEARITLSQVTTYLASTTKSNAAYKAIDAALEYVRNNPTMHVPTHLRNHHPDKKNYRYAHAYEGHFINQQYRPKDCPKFYHPTENGVEKKIKERLESLWK